MSGHGRLAPSSELVGEVVPRDRPLHGSDTDALHVRVMLRLEGDIWGRPIEDRAAFVAAWHLLGAMRRLRAADVVATRARDEVDRLL